MADDRVVGARWARFVSRVLDSARSRGMTDRQIELATGVRASTFHRWKSGAVRTAPAMSTVRAFCRGLGVDLADALGALGVGGEKEDPSPPAPVDPVLRRILRALNDPNVSATDKVFIREALEMLADRIDRPRRRKAG